MNELSELAIEKVKPAKDNPRKNAAGDVDELAQSIEAVGLLEPILVTRQNGGYSVVAGHRRLAAAKKAGLSTVPAVIRELTEQERQEAMLIENLQRQDLTPLEEAESYRRLVALGLSQRTIASRVGRNQSHISKRLQLLDLPAEALKAVDAGGITIEDALELTKLKDNPDRLLEALNDPRQGWAMKHRVEAQLEKLKLDRRINKARGELQRAGIRIVEYVTDRYGWVEVELPRSAVAVKKGSWDGIDMDPAKHAAHDCHAAAVHPSSGAVTYLCTKPANHAKEARGTAAAKAKSATEPESEKEKRRREREKEKAQMLRAREQNIELGRILERELKAPKIDADNMRLVAELVVHLIGADLGRRALRLVDESTQNVVEKKDGTISRVVHAGRTEADARDLVLKKLRAVKTAPEIMGVLLQLFVAARRASTDALPQSDRYASVSGLTSFSTYGGGEYGTCKAVVDAVEAIAGELNLPKTKKARR